MALARNTVLGIALSRELLYVIGPNGTPAAPVAGSWRAMSLGSNAGGVPPQEVTVFDSDVGITVFPFDGAPVIPVGAPPAGAKVRITFSPTAWALGNPVATTKPSLPGPEGVVLSYFSISTLFGATFAQVILASGAIIAAIPEELSLVESP